jgi:hypothetical protein
MEIMRVSEKLAYVIFVLVLFRAAHRRSEETMHSNYFDSMILGVNQFGQGIANVVEGTHRAALRAFYAIARRLSLRLRAWLALAIKRLPATATPSMAMCPSFSGSRRQRNERWQPVVVVVDAGTVGVC